MKNMVAAAMRNQKHTPLLPYSPIPLTYCPIALLPYCLNSLLPPDYLSLGKDSHHGLDKVCVIGDAAR
ncbi:hypothetical protein CK802_01470 [Brucella abortus]|nr:hypothetical protein CK802_01470 [Brucella abortus]ASZ88334.1 hypothetical protein CK803_00990 [Brucella abortus]ASZ91355.1 hypothetical protein CK805_01275 [Brucella abortus]ASZ97238.1 hypothetical protein CK806_01315 [Brucella abortus]ATA11909.1 hypothetical protein CK811_01240 [Brucella abortus]